MEHSETTISELVSPFTFNQPSELSPRLFTLDVKLELSKKTIARVQVSTNSNLFKIHTELQALPLMRGIDFAIVLMDCAIDIKDLDKFRAATFETSKILWIRNLRLHLKEQAKISPNQHIRRGTAIWSLAQGRKNRLDFKKGDVARVIDAQSLWWYVEIDRLYGFVPGNYFRCDDNSSIEERPASKSIHDSGSTRFHVLSGSSNSRETSSSASEVAERFGLEDSGCGETMNVPKKQPFAFAGCESSDSGVAMPLTNLNTNSFLAVPELPLGASFNHKSAPSVTKNEDGQSCMQHDFSLEDARHSLIDTSVLHEFELFVLGMSLRMQDEDTTRESFDVDSGDLRRLTDVAFLASESLRLLPEKVVNDRRQCLMKLLHVRESLKASMPTTAMTEKNVLQSHFGISAGTGAGVAMEASSSQFPAPLNPILNRTWFR